MEKQFFVNLFILCAVLYQGIGTSADDHMKESSNLHVRKKRLVDRTRGGSRPVQIEHVPYIVSVLEDEYHVCSGIILMLNVILTTAVCVVELDQPHIYNVLSGSAIREDGMPHTVSKIQHHPEFLNDPLYGDIALVTIHPPVDRRINQPILLYNGDVPPNSRVSTSGWGHVNTRRRDHPHELRTITVPTISLDECRNELRLFKEDEFIQKLSDKVICTYDKYVERYASIFDDGNPLVFRGRLIGVMFWSKYNGHPDIYVNLGYPPYKAWIVRMLGQIAINPY